MWIFGLCVAIFFGAPAAVVLAAVISFWRNSVKEHQALRESGEAEPEVLKKAKWKKIALTLAVVIGGVLVAAIFVEAILFSTAIAFM